MTINGLFDRRQKLKISIKQKHSIIKTTIKESNVNKIKWSFSVFLLNPLPSARTSNQASFEHSSLLLGKHSLISFKNNLEESYHEVFNPR
jgi:hypothetical protein